MVVVVVEGVEVEARRTLALELDGGGRSCSRLHLQSHPRQRQD